MSLRRASCRLSIIHRTVLLGRRSAFFAANTTKSKHHGSNPDLDNSRAFRGRAKRASIRPITLFALSIPLGYGISLALKSRDSEDDDGFVKYTLAKKEDVSSTCSIFTLRPTDSSHILHDVPSSQRAITSVQFKQPQLQIARFYTLLPPTQEQDPHEVRFLIRKERNGEVSGYLHRLPIGSEIELRGMCVEYTLPEHVDRVVFLAGGTGIAPAMQVAAAVAGEADVHVLWASRLREDCAGGKSGTHRKGESTWSLRGLRHMLGLDRKQSHDEPAAQEQSLVVAQLEALKARQLDIDSPSAERRQVVIDYYVDEEGTFIQRGDVSRLVATHASEAYSAKTRKILFVAGPDGFVNHWAASKEWVNGREVQGPLGGVLSQMNLADWEVVKL